MATASVYSLNRGLRSRLYGLLRPEADPDDVAPVQVVITLSEVNGLHGTGPLVQRICKGWSNVFSIRARNDYGGIQDFGQWQVILPQRQRSRTEFFRDVLSVLRGRNVDTILCVPYAPDDFMTAIAIRECFGARLCAYLMDDQNVAEHTVSDALMREFLEHCSLRLTTHPELRSAYETKYRLPFHLLPAVVPAELVTTEITPLPSAGERAKGALIGSFWDQRWFDRLCNALSGCGWDIDWFGNNNSPWIDFAPANLATARINPHGVIPEPQLANRLKEYPFVIVPVGELNDRESNRGVAHLSLPGRILFALATAHTPILIVGSSRTCGARFVQHFEVGVVAPYDSRKLSAAMDRMNRPDEQVRMRLNASRIALTLSDRGVSDWLTASISSGAPVDQRFDDLFAGYQS